MLKIKVSFIVMDVGRAECVEYNYHGANVAHSSDTLSLSLKQAHCSAVQTHTHTLCLSLANAWKLGN